MRVGLQYMNKGKGSRYHYRVCGLYVEILNEREREMFSVCVI